MYVGDSFGVLGLSCVMKSVLPIYVDSVTGQERSLYILKMGQKMTCDTPLM